MAETINDQISRNLKMLRKEMGMTLDDLSGASGVSKSMLSEIERGGTNPTVLVLWKIAEGLRIPLTRLTTSLEPGITVVQENEKATLAETTDYHIRTVFPYSEGTRTEILSISLNPGGKLANDGHRGGVEEVLLVTQGAVTLILTGEPHTLQSGDAARFDGSQPHELINGQKGPARIENILFYK